VLPLLLLLVSKALKAAGVRELPLSSQSGE
jgi:hypothetical protein